MIRPRYSRIADGLLTLYLNRTMRRHFHAVNLAGPVPRLTRLAPVLLVANHNTWWDGFFVHLLNRRLLHRRLHLMMLEDQLRRHRFFARTGAYSIRPEDPRGVIESLRYTLEVLNGGGEDHSLVTLFPQGELLPATAPPAPFRGGVSWLLRRITRPVTLLPLAIRVEMMEHQRPDAFLRFGQPLVVTRSSAPDMAFVEQRHRAAMEELRADLHLGVPTLPLLRGKPSINEQVSAGGWRSSLLRGVA